MDELKAYLLRKLNEFVFKLALALQFLFFLYLGYLKVYEPISRAPGARDGAGLLFVMGFVLVGAGIATAVVAALEASVIRSIFPDWRPPDLDS